MYVNTTLCFIKCMCLLNICFTCSGWCKKTCKGLKRSGMFRFVNQRFRSPGRSCFCQTSLSWCNISVVMVMSNWLIIKRASKQDHGVTDWSDPLKRARRSSYGSTWRQRAGTQSFMCPSGRSRTLELTHNTQRNTSREDWSHAVGLPSGGGGRGGGCFCSLIHQWTTT